MQRTLQLPPTAINFSFHACFLIPKNSLNIHAKNLGLFITTTFIICSAPLYKLTCRKAGCNRCQQRFISTIPTTTSSPAIKNRINLYERQHKHKTPKNSSTAANTHKPHLQFLRLITKPPFRKYTCFHLILQCIPFGNFCYHFFSAASASAHILT